MCEQCEKILENYSKYAKDNNAEKGYLWIEEANKRDSMIIAMVGINKQGQFIMVDPLFNQDHLFEMLQDCIDVRKKGIDRTELKVIHKNKL